MLKGLKPALKKVTEEMIEDGFAVHLIYEHDRDIDDHIDPHDFLKWITEYEDLTRWSYADNEIQVFTTNEDNFYFVD